ncbi:hypothetical protein BX666DRAFT_1536509 [Dichotomocladium elegans]|nr:hypothetical protein BX666DRAFT_1536509 [Dichotomocladium elegans]
MEGLSSVISGDDVENNVPTRPGSSRLSLGSSPSELSEIANLTGSGEHGNVDEDVDFVLGDGEEVLTPIEKLPVEETLFEDTSDTLSNGPVDLEDELQQQQQQAVESTSNVAASTSKMDSELTSHACDQTDDPTTTASYSATTVAETESTVTTTAIMPETRVASSVMIKQEMGEEKKEERIPTEAGNTCIHSATATVTTRNEILYEEGRERTKKEACQQQQQQQLLKDDDGDGEYEKWHKEALDALTKIEIEFARLRDT